MVATASDGKPQTFSVLGGTAIKPPERHGFDKIKYLIYDPDKGEVFTRTPKSWLLIFIFYCIYYTCLAAFWYGMMRIFLLTVPEDQPKWILDNGIIGINPGLGMQPRQKDSRIDSSLLKLKWDASNEKPSEDGETDLTIDWATRMKKFLKKYENTNGTSACSNGKEDSDPCRFDLSILGDCGNYPYGYQKESSGQVEPCIVFKVNRIFAWKPEALTNEDLDAEELEDMPKDLKDKIRNMSPQQRENLFVSCEGEWPVDRDTLTGNIEYFPKNQGIPFRFFPYIYAGQNYHSPLVAIKLKNLPRGQLTHIECRLWGKSGGDKIIRYNRKDKIGMVRFEIILEDKEQQE